MERKRIVVPPIWLLLALGAMLLLHYRWPIARCLAPPFSWLGAPVLALSVALAATAARAFQLAGTPVIPFERSTALVTSGWYRYTRNPMYLGLALVLAGTAMLLGTASPWLPIPLFVWIIQKRFIEGEERFLTELFGDEYLAYKARVRRWI